MREDNKTLITSQFYVHTLIFVNILYHYSQDFPVDIEKVMKMTFTINSITIKL